MISIWRLKRVTNSRSRTEPKHHASTVIPSLFEAICITLPTINLGMLTTDVGMQSR
ncbi:MAG: hypothetical protein Ct9H300mP14_04600 [Gammaproteobacteria bacterium]|nr:MAG: hypothetical protein Ct9H300mP14_04600 [Gammaproteobacteria bacterium]